MTGMLLLQWRDYALILIERLHININRSVLKEFNGNTNAFVERVNRIYELVNIEDLKIGNTHTFAYVVAEIIMRS